jgi:hypothetical protein
MHLPDSGAPVTPLPAPGAMIQEAPAQAAPQRQVATQ